MFTSSSPAARQQLKLMVSLATAPLLLTLVGSQAMAKLLSQWGQDSEELFRGDRLPCLPFPQPPQSHPSVSRL